MLEYRSRDTLNLVLNCLVVALALVLPVARRLVTIIAPLVIIVWLLEGDYSRKLARLLRPGPAAAVLLFVALNLLSLLWSENPAAGLIYASKYRYLLLIPVIATSLRPAFRDLAIAAFLSGVTASLVWSYGLFLGLIHTGKGYPENAAPTMNHLDYSMFLAVAALLILNRMVHQRGNVRRLLAWGGLLAFVTTGLFINIGRSGQLAFIGTLAIILPTYLPGRSVRRIGLSLVAVAMVLVLLYAAIPVFKERVDSAADEVRAALLDHSYGTNQGKRIASMIVAKTIIAEHPVLGTGVGDTMPEFRRQLDTRYRELRDDVYELPHLHNQYLQVATELGLVGILGLGLIFWWLLRYPIADKEMRSLAVILAGVYLIGFIADPFLHKQLPLVMFTLLVGLATADATSLRWTRGPHGRAP